MCGHFGFIITACKLEKVSQAKLNAGKAAALHQPYRATEQDMRKKVEVASATFNMEALVHLAIMAAERGPDGWGYFDGVSISRGKKPMNDHVMEELISQTISLNAAPWMLGMGHARLHTSQGTAKDERYLHPFHHGSIALAHNGYIRNVDQLRGQIIATASANDIDPTWIDSEVLCYLLNRYHDFDKVMGTCETDDHYAVVYYDQMLKELHLAVKNMPLYIRNDNGTYYWCSKEFDGSEKFEGHLKLTPYRA